MAEPSSSTSSLLVVGCGDLGIRAGTQLLQRGWRVDGVRRNVDALPAAFGRHAADYAAAGGLDFAAALAPDCVLATFTPSGRDVDGYRRGFAAAAANLLRGLGGHRPRRVLMVSSTRVYAEREGGWVDESAPLSSEDERALAIIAAEDALLASGLPVSVVRCSGIYGAPDGRLLSRIARGEVAAEKPLRYTNRIHRDDAAGFLVHLLEADDAAVEPVYTCSDDDPAPAHTVDTWLAQQLGLASPLTPIAPAADSGHKRCRNQRLHASGYHLRYPDFRAGYSQVLAERAALRAT
ncbi:epimerase [Mangrovimicrobium sediminis]|uniref:Epimerase n=1 Tax=Mangrovimicrobium sediminis TaxID=2562682 RepID=A0A4Z0LZD9_9GAMM|nr:NAD(P)H-binding protein [Haliea sp. SAOS-164]TGD72594.1 epimerase [Haliea sp. SAOS-164]